MRRTFLLLIAAPLLAGCGPLQPAQNNPAPPPQPQGGAPVREEARPGVTGKGNVKDPSGIVSPIVTPVNAYFSAKERLTFIQVQQAIDYNKASTGEDLKSHEEFMKLMEDQRIQLPELRPGSRYVFDVETQKLMVEHPP